MLDLPEYIKYENEIKVALMDNSSLSFMHELSQKGYLCDKILEDYDLILIPKWVIQEVEDSQYRSLYIQQLKSKGYPIYFIDEINYVSLLDDQDIYLYNIVEAVVSRIAVLMRYMRKNVYKEDLLELEASGDWINRFYDEWPLLGKKLSSGRILKKNAGEISLTILAEIFSWFYDDFETITIYTQDADTYDFQNNAEQKLMKNAEFSSRTKVPIPVSFKSNDCILCQLYRDGILNIEDIMLIRKNSRRIIYVKQQPDKSVVRCNQVVSTDLFIDLVRDDTVQILF